MVTHSLRNKPKGQATLESTPRPILISEVVGGDSEAAALAAGLLKSFGAHRANSAEFSPLACLDSMNLLAHQSEGLCLLLEQATCEESEAPIATEHIRQIFLLLGGHISQMKVLGQAFFNLDRMRTGHQVEA